MTKGEVEQIAAENDGVRETRRVLRDKQASLEQGFRICRKIMANSNVGPVEFINLTRMDLKSNISVYSYTVHRN